MQREGAGADGDVGQLDVRTVCVHLYGNKTGNAQSTAGMMECPIAEMIPTWTKAAMVSIRRMKLCRACYWMGVKV